MWSPPHLFQDLIYPMHLHLDGWQLFLLETVDRYVSGLSSRHCSGICQLSSLWLTCGVSFACLEEYNVPRSQQLVQQEAVCHHPASDLKTKKSGCLFLLNCLGVRERSVFSKYMTWLEMFFATAPQIPDFLVLLFPLEERPVLRGASTSVLSPFKVSSRVDSFLKRP